MNELDLLQNLIDETHELREVVYCLGLWVVFALFWIGGKR